MNFLNQILTPLNALLLALVSSCGLAIFKRRWSVVDRRERKDNRYERLEMCWRILSFWARQKQQTMIALNTMLVNDRESAPYVLRRLQELAQEPTPFDELARFLETGEGLSEEAEKIAQ